MSRRCGTLHCRAGRPPAQLVPRICTHAVSRRRDASRTRGRGHSGPGRRHDTTAPFAGPGTATLGTMTQPTFYPQDCLGQQHSSRAGIAGPAVNHKRLQQKKKYCNRPPCGVNTFPLKRSAEIVQLTSKFVWTGAWLTLLFKEDSTMPRIHNHDSNTHNAHTYLLQLTSKFVWTVFGRSCALSKMIFTPAHHPAGIPGT